MANEEKNLVPHQFTSAQSREEAAKNGRKGGIASGLARRKKDAMRKNLKWMLALKPQKTPEMKRSLEKLGYDPDEDYTVEDLITVGVLQKALSKDLRAIEMVYEFLAEDPHSVLEEKRLKVQEEAVSALKNADGFMEAMGAQVEEVFEDGGDTPDALEDSE